MKQKEVNLICNFLKRININQIKDKEVRMKLLKIYMKLYKDFESFDKDIQELQKRYFEGKTEALDAYNKIAQEIEAESDINKKQELENKLDPEMKTQIIEFNGLINSYLDKELDITFDKLSEAEFLNAIVDLEISFTCIDLILLQALYE